MVSANKQTNYTIVGPAINNWNISNGDGPGKFMKYTKSKPPAGGPSQINKYNS